MLVKKDMDVNEHERLYVFRIPVDRLSIIQVKLTKISYIGTLFKVQSTEDSSLFMVWFRQFNCIYKHIYYQINCTKLYFVLLKKI